LSVKARTSIDGVIDVNLAEDQPYETKTVFEAELNEEEDFIIIQVENTLGRDAEITRESFQIRSCEGKITVYTEPEKPKVIIPVVETSPSPFITPVIPNGTMIETSVDDKDFGVSYKVSNGTIREINVNHESTSVTFKLENVTEGEIIISLPRELISALDNEFIVLVTGLEQEIEYEIVKSNVAYVTLKMTLPEGIDDLTIVGTSVVPEFGVMAMIILVVSLLSMIALTKRQKLRLSLES